MKKCNLYRISVGLSAVLLIISLFAAVFLGISIIQIITALFSLIWLIISVFKFVNADDLYENKSSAASFVIGRIFVFLIITGCIFGIVSPMRSFFKWQYPFQKAYIQKYGYKCEYFPENIPDNAKEYYFEFLPSIIQGQGHTSLSFTADSEIIDEYIQRYESKSAEIFTLEEYFQGNIINDNTLILSKAYNDANFSDTMVYLLYTNNSIHHPHTNCIMINKKLGKIEFFEM